MVDNKNQDGAPPREIHVEDKKTNWLAWAALIAGLLALLFALSRCNREPAATVVDNGSAMVTNTVDTTTTAVTNTADSAANAVTTGFSGLGGYLTGTDALPRTFAFEKLNFDTSKSAVRAEDQAELDQLLTSLKGSTTSRIRVVGYADARGSNAANTALGKARADAVKAALVKGGVDAGRIDTASGGESDPVDTNATAGGQAENRRTEIVVLSR